MAFTRAYAALSGDPFRFRLPRIIRPPKKIKSVFKKVAKAVGSVVPLAASFVPGVGGIAAQLIAGRGKAIQQDMEPVAPQFEPEAAPVFAPTPIRRLRYQQSPLAAFEPPEEPEDETSDYEEPMSEYDQLLAFARAYGWQGDPAPKAKPGKLARAGSPPSVHAAAKKTNRKKKISGTADPRGGADKRRGVKKPNPFLASIGAGAGAVGRGLKAAGPGALEALKHVDIAGLYAATQKGSAAADIRSLGGMRMVGHRRRVNPANVKALRRGIRRLEGFEKLVKSVRKAAGGLRGAVLAPHSGARAYRARGHKPGCRCVACRHR